MCFDPDVVQCTHLAQNGTVFFKPFNGTAFAVLDTLLHNFFQALYHTIRLDLGISQPNQIYTSAEMYNQSISTVYIPGESFEGAAVYRGSAYANTSRRDSSNITMLWTTEQ
jgi:hypothetical protein